MWDKIYNTLSGAISKIAPKLPGIISRAAATSGISLAFDAIGGIASLFLDDEDKEEIKRDGITENNVQNIVNNINLVIQRDPNILKRVEKPLKNLEKEYEIKLKELELKIQKEKTFQAKEETTQVSFTTERDKYVTKIETDKEIHTDNNKTEVQQHVVAVNNQMDARHTFGVHHFKELFTAGMSLLILYQFFNIAIIFLLPYIAKVCNVDYTEAVSYAREVRAETSTWGQMVMTFFFGGYLLRNKSDK